MKKLRELLPTDERTKLMVGVGIVGAVLLLAMLLPLMFRNRSAEKTGFSETASDRVTLFAEYWANTDGNQYTVTRTDKISEEMWNRCETVMRTLTARCIDDAALDYSGPTGCEYSEVSDGSGTELKLCRMWLEAKGDWQNWLDVCFDAETGTVYYLYLSRECLINRRAYTVSAENADVSVIADGLCSEYGWKLRWLSSSGENAAAAVFRTEYGTACYQIESKVFDSLVDIKLCCR